MKRILKILIMVALSLIGATMVDAAVAYTPAVGLNACLGMYGDARYEHVSVPGGERVVTSGNSNNELVGFYWNGDEYFIQPWCLIWDSDESYEDYSYEDSVSYSSTGSQSSGACNRIEVNRSTQTLYHYNYNYEMDFTCHVATGIDGHETPTGWFNIVYMKTDTYLEGTNNGVPYCKHVDYWAVFYQWFDEMEKLEVKLASMTLIGKMLIIVPIRVAVAMVV